MLDLDENHQNPWRAHLIVEAGSMHAVTACGIRATPHTHPWGWRTTENGDLPLSGPNSIHCGRTPEAITAYRADKGWSSGEVTR